jgi:hypothetical protein
MYFYTILSIFVLYRIQVFLYYTQIEAKHTKDYKGGLFKRLETAV